MEGNWSHVWCGRTATERMATVQKVRNLLEKDRRFSVNTIAMVIRTLKDSMHTALKNVLIWASKSKAGALALFGWIADCSRNDTTSKWRYMTLCRAPGSRYLGVCILCNFQQDTLNLLKFTPRIKKHLKIYIVQIWYQMVKNWLSCDKSLHTSETTLVYLQYFI